MLQLIVRRTWLCTIVIVAMLLGAGPMFSQEAGMNALTVGTTYRGICDASAAVAIDESRFLVADDEESVLRLFHRDQVEPLKLFNLAEFLKPDAKEPESDLEAGARLSDGRVYWISSHGRNKNAKQRDSRHRLFATELVVRGDDVQVNGVGNPYTRLLEDMLADPRLEKYGLAEASRRAPKKKGGLNIEGLAAGPDGSLLVGFRNPLPKDQALIVPLLNPGLVVDGKERAKLGDPIELDLGGLGVRDIAYHESSKRYLIVAGPFESGGEFRFFAWSGRPDDKPRGARRVDFAALDLNPEVVFLYPGAKLRVQFLSDDGTKPVGKQECKRAAASERSFRSAWLEL